MIKYSFYLVLTFFIFSCKTNSITSKNNFTKLKIDTLLLDKISIRAIAVSENKVFYAGNKNRIGSIDLADKSKNEIMLVKDTLAFEFRSLAITNKSVFAVNIGNPATLFRVSKDLKTQKVVYEESHEKVFYDSMQFWNNQEGIAMGDPIADCLSILITRNGGNTWTKILCDNLPKTVDGEAAFAASNTNIIVKNNMTWVVSGGKKSRVFFSDDKGISWKVYETPIVQGEAMTGIFSADFYDSKIGFIAGGNYEKPEQNFLNKAITFDGGKTWKLVGENKGFGYASCIQFVPNSGGKQLVSVGATGIYNSSDFGENWKQLSDDKSLYTLRFIDTKTAVASGKDKIIRLKFE